MQGLMYLQRRSHLDPLSGPCVNANFIDSSTEGEKHKLHLRQSVMCGRRAHEIVTWRLFTSIAGPFAIIDVAISLAFDSNLMHRGSDCCELIQEGFNQGPCLQFG
jgi:hypothetical protein